MQFRAAVRLCACAAVAACASAGDPPGGPPDDAPPEIVLVSPDSGVVLTELPERVDIVFDEVVNERVAAQPPDISSAVLLSPDTGVPRVRWHRNRISVQPRGGFKAGRIYRVQLLPVITDLRTNRLRIGRVIVFSTGPDIPTATLTGTVVDWPGARAGPGGLIEAVLLPDSLPYRALTDSAGNFMLRQVPPGEYLVYGTVDQNSNRRRGAREPWDTVRLTLADSARAELFAFVHDTTEPRLRQVELTDSLTIRLTFDRPLDPQLILDTARVHIALLSDTTAPFGVAAVLTTREADSVRAADAARAQAARAAQQRDTAQVVPPRTPADSARRPAAPPRDSARAPQQPRDSTRAQRMLARRPPPSDVRVVKLLAPLTPAERYQIRVDSVRSLAGVTGNVRGQLLAPRPRPQPPPDSARAAGDTLRARPDSLRAAPDTLRAAPGTVPADTALPAAPAPIRP